ncbi:MAG: hypothetical protein IJ279_06720 [Clostridia bacterium]|nr:hypothetical protein [Clostridia bacterium]
MKKKLLSLLLVIAVMMTSVSMGFGSIVANAGAAGGGIEAINAFELTSGNATGTSFSTSITIKSKNSGYQIKVNSITATIRYYQDETSALSTAYVDSGVIGAVIGTSGASYGVTGTLNAGLAGLIRYECNYDLLDNSGNVVYAGMTGYGYGAVSANGNQTGTVGNFITNEPSTPGDSYGFGSFAQVNTCYVQTPNITLKCVTEVSGGGGGKSSESRSMSLSGNYPSTLSVQNIEWEGCAMYSSSSKEITWLTLTTPPSGYYNFTINYNGGAYANVEMYYRDDANKTNATSKLNQYLGEGREKSYYTADSWNAYLAALEKTALVGLAIPGPNYAFKLACQSAVSAATGTALENAKNALVPVAADYTALNNAVNNFASIMDSTVTVRTYDGGTSLGSETLRLYTQESVDSALAWYNSTVNMNLYKYDQLTVDGYTAEVIRLTNNLTYSDAVYTYIDVAIAEHAAKKASDYTNTTWAAYDGAVNNAKALSRSLKANSQNDINTLLNSIVTAKINLKYVQADTTELLTQIENADAVYTEYDSGKLITSIEGFDQAWENFENAYKEANAVKGYTIDKQADVDAAADELAKAIAILSDYRVLDTTELQKVLALTPEYEASKYVADSYNTWNSLRVEGYTFLGKAAVNYTGDDRKTYTHLDEMNRLIAQIRSAFEGLEKVKADFTELNEQVAKIPSDDVLALYKEEYVKAIKNIVATIDYGATFDKQAEVDEITNNLKYALAELTPANYRDADYSGVEDAIAEANALDRSIYTNFSIVDDAIAAVVEGKKIVDQDEVDAMEKAIRDAIKNLEFVLADYSDVEKAIDEAEAVENKDWYANYDRIQAIIDGIDWNITIDKQEIVDGYAKDIRDAIENLKLAEADYSGVRDAIEDADALEPLSDFNEDYIDELDLAISKVVAGYTKDRQAEVDAMEAEIRAVLARAEENLLPADYTRVNAAIAYAEGFKESEYSNYKIVKDAIDAVDWNLNCRQTEEMDAQITAIYDAVKELKLLPADYTKVEQAITDARYAYQNGAYRYTDESIAKVEEAISKVNYDLDIQHQEEVNEYIVAINQAVAGLTYIRADYTELDKAIDAYEALDRDLYVSLAHVDAFVASMNMNITIDKQADVNAYTEQLNTMLGSLEYAPADYSAIETLQKAFARMQIEHYDEDKHKAVSELFDNVNWDIKKNNQAEVDRMAEEIRLAIEELGTTLKNADLTALNDAMAAASAKLSEMRATGYEIEGEALSILNDALIETGEFNEETKITKQGEIDALTARIIEATANLEFVFTIDLEGTGLVIDENGYIYGFEEGTMAEDARELIKFVGAAELKIYETRNGFGTGTMIQFISTKDGSILGTYTVLVFGDANGDAVIDAYDVGYITEVVNSGENPDAITLKVLDLFKDGTLDAMDVTIMISLANMDATLRQDGSMGTY